MTDPKVSVIVPVYKAEKYLRQCVDSLLNQTLKELQIILVDDGSPDGCPQICDAYASQDERVQVIHKKNGGLLRARVTGVSVARADYIGFLDDDDYVAPEMFETLWRAAAEQKAQMVCSSFWLCLDEEHQTKFKWNFPTGFFSAERLETEFYPQWFENRKEGKYGLIKSVWCKLFERSLLESVYCGLPQDVTQFEDMIATFAVTARAERIVTLPDTALYYYRVVAGSMLHSYWPNYYNNMMAVLTSLAQMAHRKEAAPFIELGIKRLRAYALHDILYNECNPGKTSTKKEVGAIIDAFLSDDVWMEAAKLDVLPKDNQTSRLFRQLLLHRRSHLLQAAIQAATLKNKLIRVVKHGK